MTFALNYLEKIDFEKKVDKCEFTLIELVLNLSRQRFEIFRKRLPISTINFDANSNVYSNLNNIECYFE